MINKKMSITEYLLTNNVSQGMKNALLALNKQNPITGIVNNGKTIEVWQKKDTPNPDMNGNVTNMIYRPTYQETYSITTLDARSGQFVSSREQSFTIEKPSGIVNLQCGQSDDGKDF